WSGRRSKKVVPSTAAPPPATTSMAGAAAKSRPGSRPSSTASRKRCWSARTSSWSATASRSSTARCGRLALPSGSEDLELGLGRFLRPAVAVEDAREAHPDRVVDLAEFVDGVEALAKFDPFVQPLEDLAELEWDHR